MFLVGECAMRTLYEVPPQWREPQIRHLQSPALGWVLPPNAKGYTIDQSVEVNSFGLRDDEFSRSKPPGETRVLCLGDSFTFALGVAHEDLYVQQLERLLESAHEGRRFQVINAGVAGYNTRQELIYLSRRGFELEPDLVTVAFYWNDLVGNEPPLPDASTDVAGGDPQETSRPHVLPKGFRDALRKSVLLYQSVAGAKALAQILRPAENRYARVQRALLAGDAATLEPYWEATGARLLEMAEAARERNVPIILVVFPMENQVRHNYPDLVFAERLREIWAPTGMPFVDVEPEFRDALADGENPFLPYDLHPSSKGMAITAQALYRAIRKAELLRLGAGGGDSR